MLVEVGYQVQAKNKVPWHTDNHSGGEFLLPTHESACSGRCQYNFWI